jgi:hypothetical protein
MKGIQSRRVDWIKSALLSAVVSAGLSASPLPDAAAWQRWVQPTGKFEFNPKLRTCPDDDGDGFQRQTHDASGRVNCSLMTQNDCQDDNTHVKPGAMEICNGELDDNCDGKSDIKSEDVIYYEDSWISLLSNCPEEARFQTGYHTGICYYMYICRFCDDSDGGIDPQAAGRSSSYHGAIEDSCGSDGKLIEAVCRATWYESYPETVSLDCPQGSICRDGRCVQDLFLVPTRVRAD